MAYSLSSNVLKFQKKLAEKGDPYAQYKLGLMYESGLGAEVDFDEALKWYEKASRQKNTAATRRINYIDILKNGYRPGKDVAWLNQLKRDAKMNDGEAALLLGVMYKNGTAVDKNLPMAFKYLKKAVVRDISGAVDELLVVKALIDGLREKRQQRLNVENEARLVAERLSREKKAEQERNAAQKKQRRLLQEKRKRQLANSEAQKAKRRQVILLKADKTQEQQQKTQSIVVDEPEEAVVKAAKGMSWSEAVEYERQKKEVEN